MNPDGTNSSTNTGTTGSNPATGMGATGSVVPPALDFTSSAPTETTSLSMADSLASAADNLTSAGMAAKEPDTGSIEMDQIGASDPSATMERPDEPLVPAAPVPGSIGSVTSGPAVAAGDAAASAGFGASAGAGLGAAGFGFGGSAAGAGVGTSNAGSGFSGSTAGFGAMPTTNSMGSSTTGVAGAGAMPGFGTSATAAAGGAAGGTAAAEPYNPFAARMGASGASVVNASGAGAAGAGAQPTSSMNVPAGSQPATEKFSKKLAGAKKPNLLTVILGILAAVSLVMAIVFAILWQQAEANREVVYVPSNPDDGGNVNQTIAMVTCTKDFGAEPVEGLENLVGHSAVATLNFSDGQLSAAAMLNRYTFVDNGAAEASRPYFDGVMNWYNDVAAGWGVSVIGSSVEVVEATTNFNATANADQLVGDYIGVFGLPVNAEGGLDGSREGIQANYEANGYVCAED